MSVPKWKSYGTPGQEKERLLSLATGLDVSITHAQENLMFKNVAGAEGWLSRCQLLLDTYHGITKPKASWAKSCIEHRIAPIRRRARLAQVRDGGIKR